VVKTKDFIVSMHLQLLNVQPCKLGLNSNKIN